MDEAIPHKIGLHEMTRVRAVWEHPVFQRELARLEELERDRPFCRHGIQHLLDTARIMRILNLEQGLGFSREVVYATALLHDVGKAGQYAGGEPHEVAGERLARKILESAPPDTRFAPMTSTRCVSPSAASAPSPGCKPAGAPAVPSGQGLTRLFRLPRRGSRCLHLA